MKSHPPYWCGLLACAGLGLLGGCMPTHPPRPLAAAVALPDTWREGPQGTGALQTQWWRGIGDPVLERLVERALRYNNDLLLAASRIEEAEAAARIADAAGWPTLSASVSNQSSRSLGTRGLTLSHVTQPGVQLGWETDLWGRLRLQGAAAALRTEAARADQAGAQVSVAAATAQAYVRLRALDAQHAVSRATASSRAEALRLAADQARVGYISQLQLTQAEAEYEAVQQTLPQLELAVRQQENALRILTGEPPGPAERGQPFAALRLPAVPATLPAELLQRRPDIARAERLLAASDATLAAQRRAFLPQVSLSANAGRLFTNALHYDPVTIWSIGGSILAPLFTAGRLQAQVDAATAQRDQAAFAYRGVVLNALGEVENALAAVERLRTQREHTERRRDVLARSLGFAQDRYQAGYASHLEVLDAQRNLYQAEIERIRARQGEMENRITLYRVLGGGWQAGSAER